MAELLEVTEEESWELLATREMCRVAWTRTDGPVVLPMNFRTHNGTIWLRSSAHAAIAAEVDDDLVAILVDDLDDSTRSGWSIQLRGYADVHYSTDQVPPEVRTLKTWAGGPKPLWIKVEPLMVIGRRLPADAVYVTPPTDSDD